jgi:hypothetical protein
MTPHDSIACPPTPKDPEADRAMVLDSLDPLELGAKRLCVRCVDRALTGR